MLQVTALTGHREGTWRRRAAPSSGTFPFPRFIYTLIGISFISLMCCFRIIAWFSRLFSLFPHRLTSGRTAPPTRRMPARSPRPRPRRPCPRCRRPRPRARSAPPRPPLRPGPPTTPTPPPAPPWASCPRPPRPCSPRGPPTPSAATRRPPRTSSYPGKRARGREGAGPPAQGVGVGGGVSSAGGGRRPRAGGEGGRSWGDEDTGRMTVVMAIKGVVGVNRRGGRRRPPHLNLLPSPPPPMPSFTSPP